MGAISDTSKPIGNGRFTAKEHPGEAPPDRRAPTALAEVHTERLTLSIVRHADGTDDFLAFPSETSPFFERLRKDGRLRHWETRDFEFIILPNELNAPAQLQKLRSLHKARSEDELCIVTIVGHFRSFFAAAILARQGEFEGDEVNAISRDFQTAARFAVPPRRNQP